MHDIVVEGGAEVDNVKVVVRCRPLDEQEIREGHHHAVQVNRALKSVTVSNPASENEPPKTYTFDEVFGNDSDQITIYNSVARPIVENVLKGYNGTIFAYGQTGTGKTYTMSGDDEVAERRGIIPNSFAHIFDHIAKCKHNKTFLVRVSYLEIYNEEVRDLLVRAQKNALEIKERPDVGVYVKDLLNVTVANADHMFKIMQFGNSNRHTGATCMNEKSSRSHALFTVTIECSEESGPSQHLTQGKLHLVDLAGSERQTKTQAVGERLKEASKINLSLSTLGNVISALVDPKATHIPYRNSKLTRLLQDSLGGNSKTVMIANIGPATYNYDETISTLRYANRAKNIKNVVKINEDPKDALLRKFQQEIEQLKRQLENDEFSDDESDGADEITLRPHENSSLENNNNNNNQRLTAANQHYEERIKEMEREVEANRKILNEEQGMMDAERRRLVEDLQRKEDELSKSKQEHEQLMSKLMAIEKKLIVGGENMLEKAENQAKLLEESNRELERAQRSEKEMQRRLESRQAERLDMEEKYNTLQEEVQGKTRKLKKIWSLYMQAKGDLKDMETENQREIEALLDNVRQLQKELMFSVALIDSYIPEDYLKLIEKYVYWNEEIGDWQLKCIAYTGNNMRADKPNHPIIYKPIDLQSRSILASYAELLGTSSSYSSSLSLISSASSSTINSQNNNINTNNNMSSAAITRPNFRPKSAMKDRNAARIRALLE